MIINSATHHHYRICSYRTVIAAKIHIRGYGFIIIYTLAFDRADQCACKLETQCVCLGVLFTVCILSLTSLLDSCQFIVRRNSSSTLFHSVDILPSAVGVFVCCTVLVSISLLASIDLDHLVWLLSPTHGFVRLAHPIDHFSLTAGWNFCLLFSSFVFCCFFHRHLIRHGNNGPLWKSDVAAGPRLRHQLGSCN